MPNVSTDAMEPMAIIGMAARYPGKASTLEGFWELLSNARSAVSDIPKDRWNMDSWYHPNPDRRGTTNVKKACFLDEDVSLFDAPFFSMTAQEASGMDPMQRLMLEVAYESLENAGIPMQSLPGSKTSVYCGCFTGDYGDLANSDIYNASPYQATGKGKAMLSNRVSWFFDLRGSSFTVDTACSSSLYALHTACQSLRLGESNMAIVGGTNLLLTPDMMHSLTVQHFLSPDGVSHSFDDRANGYGRGEGIGAIIIKPLRLALADGDTIRAVIRGSGLNQDGKTPGITMPAASAQADLIRSTYLEAGLSLNDTSFFQAHGTGTALGDPIELSAIGATFGKERTENQAPLYISSVKTNIGHTEGSSGLAGVIATVLSLEKGLIPANAGFENLNPKIRLGDWKCALPPTAIKWPNLDLRRASVNSFGYGGANAHVILDDAYNYLRSRGLHGNHQTFSSLPIDDNDSGFNSDTSLEESTCVTTSRLFVFSSHDQAGLKRLSEVYSNSIRNKLEDNKKAITDLKANHSEYMQALAYTLAQRRTIFDYRSFIVARSMTEMHEKLEAGLPKLRRVSKNNNAIWVFTGQGAQWPTMGVDLLNQPAFEKSIRKSQTCLERLGCNWNVYEELARPDAKRIDRPEYSQPLCTILQLGLIELLRWWKLTPKAVVGHSSGEIAAAFAAEIISHEDAINIAYQRGVYSADVQRRKNGLAGAMLAAGVSAEEAEQYLTNITNGSAVVACHNSPSSVTISGDEAAIDQVELEIKKNRKFARKLRVQTAYHSDHMKVVADDYLASMGAIKTSPASVPMFSSVTEALIPAESLDASYWVSNMVQPVKFSGAVKSLLTHTPSSRGRRRAAIDYSAIIEIGPHEALKGPLNQILTSTDSKLVSTITYTSLLQRGNDAEVSSMEAIASLWSQGIPIDISRINRLDEGKQHLISLIDLPPYPWNHSKGFWHEPSSSVARRFQPYPRTDLLGAPIENQNPAEPRWRNILRLPENPWLEDHKIQGSVLFPAAGMLAMVLEAAQQLANKTNIVKGFELRNVTFHTALVIPPSEEFVETSLSIRPIEGDAGKNWYNFTVYSLPGKGVMTAHCRGIFTIVYDQNFPHLEAHSEWQSLKAAYDEILKRSRKIGPRTFYKDLAAVGMQYGPLFRNMTDANADAATKSAHGTIVVPDVKSTMPYKFDFPHLIHPATLDAIFHLLFLGFSGGDPLKEAAVPVSMQSMFIAADASALSTPGSELRGFAKCFKKNQREAGGDVFMSTPGLDEAKIAIRNFVARDVSSSAGITDTLEASGFSVPKRTGSLTWLEDVDNWKGNAAEVLLKKEENAGSIDGNIEGEDLYDRLQAATWDEIERSLHILSGLDEERLQPHFRQYVQWLRQQRVKLSSISSQSDMLKSSQDADLPDQFRDLRTVGENMADILSGHISLRDVIMPEPSHAMLVESTHGLQKIGSSIRSWLDRLCHKEPKLNVLIVGNGLPSIATEIAREFGPHPHRRLFERLTLTDISNDALSSIKQELEAKDLQIDYLPLDMADSPTDQGLVLQSFDLIIAPVEPQRGVSLDDALKSWKSLLRPQGRLALCGFDCIPQSVQFVQGLFEEWWAHDEFSAEESAVRDSEYWDGLLKNAGFRGTEIFLKNPQGSFGDSTTLAITSLVEEPTEQPTEVIILEAPCPSADVLALKKNLEAGLQATGFAVRTSSIADASALKGTWIISLVEIEKPFVFGLTARDLEHFKTLVSSAEYVLWITRGGQMIGSESVEFSPTTGLLRTIRVEMAQISIPHLDLSPTIDLTTGAAKDAILRSFNSSSPNKGYVTEMEYAERQGSLLIPRFVGNDSFDNVLESHVLQERPSLDSLLQQERPLKLAVSSTNMLSGLRWVDDEEALLPLSPDDVEIKASFVALNQSDLDVASGHSSITTLGREVSGTVTRVGINVARFKPGQEVVAVRHEACRTHPRQGQHLVHEVPERLTSVAAVSCARTYLTAYHILVKVARIQAGESLLIPVTNGSLDQALLELSLFLGAVPYVTVDTDFMKQFFMDKYKIPEERILFDRGSSVGKSVQRLTKGTGVDVVINVGNGETVRQAWECIAEFGRLIDLSQQDDAISQESITSALKKNVTFARIDMESLEQLRSKVAGQSLEDVFTLLRDGSITPMSQIETVPISEVDQALQKLKSEEHNGKLVLDLLAPNVKVPIIPPQPAELQLNPSATYVLSGGLGGLGPSIAHKMIKHGARHLVFLSRSGASTADARSHLRVFEELGCKADAFACDISDATKVEAFFQTCKSRGWNIKGVIQCAMVLRDAIFINMTHEMWQESTQAKIQGSWNLHKVLGDDVDFFIMLSSVSGIIGNPAQANYTAGNTYQDALACFRQARGLPATALAVGAVMDVGNLAENSYFDNFLEKFEHLADLVVTEQEVLTILTALMGDKTADGNPIPPLLAMGFTDHLKREGNITSLWSKDRKFDHRIKRHNAADIGSGEKKILLSEMISQATSLTDAGKIVEDALKTNLANAMTSLPEDIDAEKALHSYGVDSLKAVEVRNWLFRELKCDVSVFDILSPISLASLSVNIALKSKFLQPGLASSTTE